MKGKFPLPASVLRLTIVGGGMAILADMFDHGSLTSRLHDMALQAGILTCCLFLLVLVAERNP